jgi:hypothetical protein
MTSAASETSTSAAISAISIAFCSVFDEKVPTTFNAVSATTLAAAHTAELFSPRRSTSDA